MGSIARIDLKVPSKCWDVSWPSPPTPNSKYFFFQSESPEPPPPPPLNKLNTNKVFMETRK